MFKTITSNVTKFTMYWWFGVGFFKCNYFDHNKGEALIYFFCNTPMQNDILSTLFCGVVIIAYSDAFILFLLIQGESM